MGKHDKLYKKLFSNPKLVEELLTSFVNEDFVKKLDFSTLVQLDKSFVTDEFIEKESDIFYKINYQNEEIYLFLLIEFQSTVDKFMALRILRYELEFYDFYIKSQIEKKQSIDKLPPLFPILLYNGNDTWTAPTNIKDLIKSDIPAQYIPDFSYFKVIENTFSREHLLNIKNALSAVFFVENSNPEDLKFEIDNLISLIEKESPEIINIFRNWFRYLLDFNESDNKVIEKLDEIKEVKTMFTATLETYAEKLRNEGIERGIERGIEKGIERGIKKGKLEDARNLKNLGVSSAIISKATGLSAEEIEKL